MLIDKTRVRFRLHGSFSTCETSRLSHDNYLNFNLMWVRIVLEGYVLPRPNINLKI